MSRLDDINEAWYDEDEKIYQDKVDLFDFMYKHFEYLLEIANEKREKPKTGGVDAGGLLKAGWNPAGGNGDW